MDEVDGFTVMPDDVAMPNLPGFSTQGFGAGSAFGAEAAPAQGRPGAMGGLSKRSKLPMLSAEEGQRQLEMKLEAERMSDEEFEALWRELRRDALSERRVQERPFERNDARFGEAGPVEGVEVVQPSQFDADFEYITEDGQVIDGAELVRKMAQVQSGGQGVVHARRDGVASAPVQHISYDGEADSDADMAAIEVSGARADAPSFEEAVAKLTETVTRSPRFREILRKTLLFCRERHELGVVEQEIMTYPEYKYAAQNPYRLIRYLIDADGLYLLELDEQGDVVTQERKVGLTEDEVDDLVVSFALEATPVGEEVAERLDPHKRITELLAEMPVRFNSYLEVLDFCKQPRTITEINELFKGRDLKALGTLHSDLDIPIQPSVFVDKLERVGALVWKDKWVLTPEGEAFLRANPFAGV